MGTLAESPRQGILEFPGFGKLNNVIVAHSGVPLG